MLDEVCMQTANQPHTQELVGCLSGSTIACALSKVTGKPIIIQNETGHQETKTTRKKIPNAQFLTLRIPPLIFSDLSLLLALDAVILNAADQLVLPHYGSINFTINKRHLRNVLLTMGLLFLITVII